MKAPVYHSVLPLAVCLLLAGCDSKRPPEVGLEDRPQPTQSPRTTGGPRSGGEGENLKQRQADFLNRIREADPQGKTIERALLNEQNELGLILDRQVQLDDIPKLMRGMLGQMAKEFPGQDLTIIAYTPSNPPKKIGTARLDARSRDMTYTPES